MRAARLYAPADIRVETLADPPPPGPGQALIRITSVGICGSDLHTYTDGRIGDTSLAGPLILGHEFGAVVESVGRDGLDGNFQPLAPGTTVAVDPAQPCEHCVYCDQGNPNLCLNLRFCGLSPNDGAMCQWMVVPSRTCFPVAASADGGEVSLLETLGVAVHSVDLAHLRIGERVAILGAGPVGLCILQCARLAGARVYITDQHPWRLDLAARLGGIPINFARQDVIREIHAQTAGQGEQGVDAVFEAAWAGPAIEQAAHIVRPGGRLILVGIPGNDDFRAPHALLRRKGLTIRMVRRMKHVYPRVIALHQAGQVDLGALISHRFPLERTAEAFRLNAAYAPGVVKVMIDVGK